MTPVFKERTRKLFCDFPIAESYFAWLAANRAYASNGKGPVSPYLEKQNFEALRSAAGRAKALNRLIRDVLTMVPTESKSVYVLLDRQDWMTDAQLNELWTQINRTARPGARVLFRTGGAQDILPGRDEEASLSQWSYDKQASGTASKTDRSAICGGVHL
ncbi:DUF3419 family protein [Ruegeria sp. Ofav3-42]|nr:DUF3419 family protein [Ruegeria sp. Ofav3-42]